MKCSAPWDSCLAVWVGWDAPLKHMTRGFVSASADAPLAREWRSLPMIDAVDGLQPTLVPLRRRPVRSGAATGNVVNRSRSSRGTEVPTCAITSSGVKQGFVPTGTRGRRAGSGVRRHRHQPDLHHPDGLRPQRPAPRADQPGQRVWRCVTDLLVGDDHHHPDLHDAGDARRQRRRGRHHGAHHDAAAVERRERAVAAPR